MTSPDFSEYIDLTVNDLQPDEIYQLTRDYALLALPEFNPRTGTVEDALLQSMAYVSGLITGAINRLPNSLIEGLLRVMGFYRRESTFASGSVILTALDNGGLTIPAGTQFGYNETTDDEIIFHLFETTETASIPEGDTVSSPIQIAATEAGEKPVIPDGEPLIIITPIVRLLSAEFDGTLTQGTTTENDASFFSRATTYLSSLSRSLANANQVTDYILTNYSTAYRVGVYDLTRLIQLEADSLEKLTSSTTVRAIFANTGSGYHYAKYYETGRSLEVLPTASIPDMSATSVVRVTNTGVPAYETIWGLTNNPGTSGSVTAEYTYNGASATVLPTLTTPTSSPLVEILDTVRFDASDVAGAVTIFVSDSTGASLTAEEKGVIADDVRSRCIAGLDIFIGDVILANIDVAVSIAVLDGYSTLDVRTAVDEYLTLFLSPEEYPFTTLIRKNELIASVSQIAGVRYVDSLTLTVDADSAELASVNGTTGDVDFVFRGTLPVASVTVSSV